jgi:hypothetical protein
MNAFTQVMAVLVGLTLVVVGILESFFYRRPELYPIFLIRPEDVPAVRLWTVNLRSTSCVSASPQSAVSPRFTLATRPRAALWCCLPVPAWSSWAEC